jgi:hypothetical protein
MRCVLHSILVRGMAATSLEGGERFDFRIQK